MNAWQWNMGYCRLYDEASVILGMIIDCEPIYFEYDDKKWLIEFWKGQYDLAAGAEIGIYNTKESDIKIPGIFEGPFFKSVSDEEALSMAFTLKKNNEVLFKREGNHWWLTGFKLGMFSEPSELILDLNITLKDNIMLNSFLNRLKRTGYSDSEIKVSDNTVYLTFDKPHSPQPVTRTKEADLIIQLKNKILCDKYKKIVKNYDSFPDQLNAIHEQAPELYEKIISIDRTKGFFSKYEKFIDYLIKEN